MLSLHLASYNNFLLELHEERLLEIASLKLGTYCSTSQIRTAFSKLPGAHRTLHLDTYLSHRDGIPQRELDLIGSYIDLTSPQWISAHLAFGCSEIVKTVENIWNPALGSYIYKNADELLDVIAHNAEQLQKATKLPVLFENIPSVGPNGERNAAFQFVSQASFISEFFKRTSFGLLLDLAHAQVAAANFTPPQDVREYLTALPLDRVREIHISGPTKVNGILLDSNKPLAEEDIELLKWTLERTNPDAVTLEYWENKEKLYEQVKLLESLLK